MQMTKTIPHIIFIADMTAASLDGMPSCRAEALTMDGPFLCTRPEDHPMDYHAAHNTQDFVVAIWPVVEEEE
jgi:hypothetical protein